MRSIPRARAVLILVLASALGGCGHSGTDAPASLPSKPADEPWFEEVALARGLRFEHRSGQKERYLFPEIACGGAALFDMEGDGDLDAYLVQAGSVLDPPETRAGNQLFANRGDGSFEDRSAGSGAEDRGYGMGVAAGDCDDDGDVDLYVTNLAEDALLQNLGGGKFEDVTRAAGASDPLWSTSAAFFDYDRDGDLDLFVANYIYWSVESERTCYSVPVGKTYCGPLAYDSPTPSTLFRNGGGGRFVDVSAESGVRRALGNGLGVGVSDFDGDGWLDVFVANDSSKNHLWMNQRDGTFLERAVAMGCAVDQDGQVKAGMGVALVDFDGDTDEDLLVVNLGGELDSFLLNEKTHFVDRTASVGLARESRAFTRFGVGFQDFDNDGLVDLFMVNGRVTHGPESLALDPLAEPNLLYRGVAGGGVAGGGVVGGRLEEVLPRGGTAELLLATSRAAAFGDVDGDGGMDVLVVNRDGPAHLLRNRISARGNWIRFRVLLENGRDALDALVRVRVGGREVVRHVRSAYSYCAANDSRVQLGLGQATEVEEVLVRWPGGDEESFGGRTAGREWKLIRGAGREVAR